MAKMKASVKNGMQGRKIKRSPADQAVQVLIYLFIASFALITLCNRRILCDRKRTDRTGIFHNPAYNITECIQIYLCKW